MIKIGLTGSIGMGKSTASQMFRDLGIPVHCADKAAHDLMAPGGKAVDAILEHFPSAKAENNDGQAYIDRQKLGQIVLAAPLALKKLEEILHPLIKEDSQRYLANAKKLGHKIVIFDIPLLFEKGRDQEMDQIICITAPEEVQRERVLARPNMTEEKFQQILAKQIPDAEKRKRSDIIIESHHGMDAMRNEVQKTVDHFLKKKPQLTQNKKPPKP